MSTEKKFWKKDALEIANFVHYHNLFLAQRAVYDVVAKMVFLPLSGSAGCLYHRRLRSSTCENMTLNIILLVLAQQPCFIEEELACLLLHNWAIHAYMPHSILENAQKQEKHKGLQKRYIYNMR